MTERVVKPKGRKKKETVRASASTSTSETPAAKASHHAVSIASKEPAAPLDMPLQNPMFPTNSRHAEQVEKATTAIRYHYRPPTFNQPSKALSSMLDNAFLTHYVELNHAKNAYAPEIQWLVHLPEIFTNASKPAVKISLRAMSMAFYGKYHNDSSILIDSWRWYTVALSAQRNSIARMKKNDIPDEGEVLVPLILALYELYVGATSAGLLAHMDAAGEIMKMRGPSNCRSGVILPLFKAIRGEEAHRSIVFNNKSTFSSPDWMTIPFVDMPSDPHQDLASIHLMIPFCLAHLEIQGSLRTVFETPIPPNVDVTPAKELTWKLLKDLDSWAEKYPHLTKRYTIPGNTQTPELSSQSPKQKSPKTGKTHPARALISSKYMADRVLLNMLMYKMHTESSTPLAPSEYDIGNSYSEVQSYSQAILQTAAEIERAKTPGFDLLRTIGPVVIVVYCAPILELKMQGQMMLGRWAGQIQGLASTMERL
ncbi:hypothetical protein COCMIDRAFT_87063 [Bipolaris oryzae ATCC 44560]|uniref:Uncharacterized protein n=1 Tax=Bipolaris oryzae ATCC 44560 TaxID=930090 RepID=W6ZF85_COCMI|nr:uncharacterized protein COCMIDRAFT_87063 [Bipolaris oryzae ATCC 44560]EUC48563.1 hypothetical protein COCMIDRAFT_87063 [Bipolaris oryzae ATCC 44560]